MLTNASGINGHDEDCPFCRKFSIGPCGHVFSIWHAQCVKTTPTTMEQKSACQEMAQEMVDCWKRHDAYYQTNPGNMEIDQHQRPKRGNEMNDNLEDDSESDQVDNDELLSSELHQQWVGIVKEIHRIYPNPIILNSQQQRFQFRLVIGNEAQILLPMQDLDHEISHSLPAKPSTSPEPPKSTRRSLVVAFCLVNPVQDDNMEEEDENGVNGDPQQEVANAASKIRQLFTAFATSLPSSSLPSESSPSESSSSPSPILVAAGSVDDLVSVWDNDKFPSQNYCVLPIALPSATIEVDVAATEKTFVPSLDAPKKKSVTIAVYALYEEGDEVDDVDGFHDQHDRDNKVNDVAKDDNMSGRFYATTMTIPCILT